MRLSFRLSVLVALFLSSLYAEDVYVNIPGSGEFIKFLQSTHNCSGTDSNCMTLQEVIAADLQFGDACGTYASYSQNIGLDKLQWTTSEGYDSAGIGGPDYYHCHTIGECKVYNVLSARVCLSPNSERVSTYIQWASINTDMPCGF